MNTMMDIERRERIAIRNDLAELRRMTQWLQDSARMVDVPQEFLYALDVCANEAVTNIISYAYDDNLRHDITLELSRTANGACLVIRDDGNPFNPLEAPPHQGPASLEDAMIGGLGIHLIRRMMTRCDYRREADVNVLCLEAERKVQPGNA